jgi:hypothetical protein
MRTLDLVIQTVGVAGFEPRPLRPELGLKTVATCAVTYRHRSCRWSALVRQGAIEPFVLDHLPDFSQRETELHVPTATTDSDHLGGGHGRDLAG